ncbi:DNA gyrase subunit B [Enhygromyxa salina]|uniref:DNA gyrase subunit B n=1 Tax=Enhygromyxa salina TaxID=215803 RepID=A0A0C2CV13_9BACT|nr:DNA gyrase subunit B [Enhygromyxa salina]
MREAFDGLVNERKLDTPEELPASHDVVTSRVWVSSQPRRPRERLRIIANIRDNPFTSVGDITRPAALGTMLEGAMSFAIDDVIDGRCEGLEIRLLTDGSAMVTHTGPGFDPDRAARGLQRWPWLRRSAEGQVMLTQSLAAPVVTCALSHWCRIEITRDDGVWHQAFYRGEAECPLTRDPPKPGQQTRTRVCFRPDPEIFGELRFCVDDLYMRGLGFLMELAQIELRILDERNNAPPLIMYGTGGLSRS